MGTFRCFIGIELPRTMRAAIVTATSEPRARLGQDLVRWVPNDNVHLTLKFLGDTAPSGLESVQDAMAAAAPKYRAFQVVVEGLGAFPNSRNPRVLWVGLTAPPELTTLARDLDVATARLGYESDGRGFSPHLTIGRVRQNLSAPALKQIRNVLEQTRMDVLGTFVVDRVHVYQSVLGPTGSHYTRLASAALAAA